MSYDSRGGHGYGNQSHRSSHRSSSGRKSNKDKSREELIAGGNLYRGGSNTGKEFAIANPNAPPIEQSLKVRLPNGKISTVNVFDYNLASAVHQSDPEKWVTVELDDGGNMQVGNLTPIFKGEDK